MKDKGTSTIIHFWLVSKYSKHARDRKAVVR